MKQHSFHHNAHCSLDDCQKIYILFLTKKEGMVPISKIIEARISAMEPGSVFVPADFHDIATIDNANTVLSRMVKDGRIIRALRGVYAKPRHSKLLDKDTLPSPDDIAHAIARGNKWIIAPSGDTALNRLGLDTQVPATYEYVSSGPYKTYQYGRFTITLKHRANRDLLDCSPLTCLIIQALKALGKEAADEKLAQRLAQRLSEDEVLAFYYETRNSTSWVFGFAKMVRAVKEC